MKKTSPITTITTVDGKYTVIYGIHVMTQDPRDIPSDTTAVILETGMHSYLEDPLHSLQRLRQHVQYRELFTVLEKKKIPVVFADLKYRFPDPLLLMVDTAFSGVEWMAGMRLIKNRKKKPLNFLIGAWLLMPFVTNVLRLVSAFIGRGQKHTGELKKISHRLHPEADLLYLTVRNAVIAEKAAYIMQEKGNNAHIVIVLGAGHVGIEDMLQKSSEKRLEQLNKFSHLIKKLVHPAYFYTYISYHNNEKGWKIAEKTEVDSLKRWIS
jgi:hypothetical protein